MFSYKSEGYNTIKFTFVTDVHVTKEKLKVSFDLLLGEIGGFVGMILGRVALIFNNTISLSFSRSFSDGPGEAGSGRLGLVQQESWLGGSERGGQEV